MMNVDIDNIGSRARLAQQSIAKASNWQKNSGLQASAELLMASVANIIAANNRDIELARAKSLSSALIERLVLDNERIDAMAQSLVDISELDDPVGKVIAHWQRPNGLVIERVSTPIGVIGIIFESRPNVLSDAGGLCLKAGNATILRCGSDSLNSCQAIHHCLNRGLERVGLNPEIIQLVPSRDRGVVGAMLGGLNGQIDVIIPRGGKELVARVKREAKVPVFAHLEGICHTYVGAEADLAMAVKIIVNAKMRRVAICGATECVLIDRAVVQTHTKPIIEALLAAGCTIYGDDEVCQADTRVSKAGSADWGREYLDAKIAVKIVDDINAAMDHIRAYGSQHTDAIITDDQKAADDFLTTIDSAIVMHNTSTQFADGGEFGMGAEVGISTSKFHARGPIGIEQLTTFNYRVCGQGQLRD